jgi:hypothetical protein
MAAEHTPNPSSTNSTIKKMRRADVLILLPPTYSPHGKGAVSPVLRLSARQ